MSGEIDLTVGFLLDEDTGEAVTLSKLNQLIEDIVVRIQAGAVGEREIADGSISREKLAEDIDDQITIPAGAVTTSKLAPSAVTPSKLSGACAGDGLTPATGGELDVNVDDSTLEVDTDVVQVKDDGIVTAKIADANVTLAKMATAARPNVVGTTKTDTQTWGTGDMTAWQAVTGLTAVITPSSTNSTILLNLSLSLGSALVSSSADHSATPIFVRLTRGGSPIAIGDADGSRTRATTCVHVSDKTTQSRMAQVSLAVVDSPASTSAQTYGVEIQMCNNLGYGTNFYVNKSTGDTDSAYYARSVSSLVAQEVHAV